MRSQPINAPALAIAVFFSVPGIPGLRLCSNCAASREVISL